MATKTVSITRMNPDGSSYIVNVPKKKFYKDKMTAFDYINYGILIICALIAAYPLWFVFIGAFSDGQDYMNGGVWLLPRKLTLSNFEVIVSDEMLWYALKNTVLATVIGTLTSLLFTALVSYAMSRPNLKWKKFFRIFNLFTMFFGGGLIPTFVLLRIMGFFDNFLIYIIPSLYSVYNMIIISSFYGSISNELHESAVIDGANEVTIWWKIYMPLSKPILATVTLWGAVAHWNSYFTTMIYSNGQKNMITLQYYLMGVINKSQYSTAIDPAVLLETSSKTVGYASIVLATLPILFVYPFLQRYFTSGSQLGATKG